MTKQEVELVRKFGDLLKKKIQVHSLIVFGSRARGDAEADSDLDVLVITEEPRTSTVREFVSACAWEASFDSGIVLSSIIVSQEEWEHGPQRYSFLASAIAKEGITV